MNDTQKLALLKRLKRANEFNKEAPDPASNDESDDIAAHGDIQARHTFEADHEIGIQLDIDLTSDSGQSGADSAAGTHASANDSEKNQTSTSRSAEIHEFPDRAGRSEYQSLPVGTRGNSNLLNPVHSLPLKSLQKYGLLLPDSPRCSLGEQYRHIKRSLMLNIRNAKSGTERLSTIMVTSAVSGEGKTFSALNLALSYSQERDHSVLFIDADVLKASASRLLGFDTDTPGLTDLLAGDVTRPFDICHATQYSNLCVIPAGTKQANTTELLSTRRMSDILTTYCQDDKQRIIILDAPPLLQTTEACALADHAGQIAFVVSSATTGRSTVKAALAKIGKDKQVGLIINKLRHSTNDARYNYSYN